MKLKKSLLALSTAAAVAVAGTPAAFAADSDWGSLGANNNQTAATGQNNAGGSDKADQGANNNDTNNQDTENPSADGSSDNQTEGENGAGQNNNPEDPNKTAGPSSDAAKEKRKKDAYKFFGWKEDASGFEIFKSVAELIATIVGIFTGLSSLNDVVGKFLGGFAK
ncbi:hypothetical protein GC425_04235 [Corynebacterium sp. zg254]|uniref:Secreted protein n=1 Tax=Corynebacterium zhongnanshanii TaxID=2768834 RepID=A0ABQ6VEN9_9CORY|nr:MULTISPECIES: hypothetical protein [Corynebacterium]KAB3522850.1 hypothetical protein F8377_01385 [Corynebacterium zhongnanshanii]MCR5914079.1 hypothetical protein [Corynebacterium sp. zg254]